MNSNPVLKITFDCDIADSEINYYLNREIALESGVWQIAFESVSLEFRQAIADTVSIFDLRCSLVRDLSRIDGQYMLQHTSLNRFPITKDTVQCIKNASLRWFMINNYHSDHITFYLTRWPQSPETKKIKKTNAGKLSFEILLQRLPLI